MTHYSDTPSSTSKLQAQQFLDIKRSTEADAEPLRAPVTASERQAASMMPGLFSESITAARKAARKAELLAELVALEQEG